MQANTKHKLFDRYSLVHAAWGVVFETLGVSDVTAIGAQILFEAGENTLKRATQNIWPDSQPDGWENHVGDVLSFTAGFYSSRTLRAHAPGKAALLGFIVGAAAGWLSLYVSPVSG